MSDKKELMINSSQSFSDSEKAQGRTNLGDYTGEGDGNG